MRQMEPLLNIVSYLEFDKVTRAPFFGALFFSKYEEKCRKRERKIIVEKLINISTRNREFHINNQ